MSAYDHDLKSSDARTLAVRFRSRLFHATGRQSDDSHPNVLRVAIDYTLTSLLVQTLIGLLPLSARSWLQVTLPEWALPLNIVVKIEKPNWDDEFDVEQATYERLRSLQGLAIPICYGQAKCQGRRCLLLSDIGGHCVAKPEGAILQPDVFASLLQKTLAKLARSGIRHDDMKLDNYHLIRHQGEWAIMAVDLEHVVELMDSDETDLEVQMSVKHLLRMYRNHLECLREDGLLVDGSQA